MEYFLSHLPQALVVIGLVLLAIEILVMGFSTFVLFFIAIGTIITGALMMVELMPETMLVALLSTAIVSAIVAVVSWQPMKRMQNKVESNQVDNDVIGYEFMLPADLELGKTITYHYSGIDWKVRAKEALVIGTEVKIIKMDVGILTVERSE